MVEDWQYRRRDQITSKLKALLVTVDFGALVILAGQFGAPAVMGNLDNRHGQVDQYDSGGEVDNARVGGWNKE